MSYSYSTLRPYQIEAVRTGKGHLSSAHELRNLFAETQNEVYLAAAERIESLERQLRNADIPDWPSRHDEVAKDMEKYREN